MGIAPGRWIGQSELSAIMYAHLDNRLWGTSRFVSVHLSRVLGMTTVAPVVALRGDPAKVLPMRAQTVLLGGAFTTCVAA